MDVTGHTSAAAETRPGTECAGAQGRVAPPMASGGVMRVPGSSTRPVSIRDVAAAAGVSYQTVSRVINGHPSVRESTRELVLDVIARLGFRPNRAARTLAGGPVQSVTVLTSNTTLYGRAMALQGIEEAARSAGFALGVRVVESAEPGDVRDAVERAVEPGTALIIIAIDQPGIDVLRAVPPGVPMAAIVEPPAGDEGAGRPWVWLDDGKAARDATRHLLSLGHPTVHYVSIPTWTRTGQRMAGWRSALLEAGVPVPEPLPGGWGPQAGYEAGRKLARDPDVTAVLCGNDDLALGVIRAMHEAGRSIPGNVSIVGFDDTPLSAYYTPALTTVRQDFTALGRACFATLLSVLNPQADSRPVPWPQATLIVRESAGPPPSPRIRPGAASDPGQRSRPHASDSASTA